MAVELNPLTDAARLLANAAPIEFLRFVEAMQQYAEKLAYDTVAAEGHEQMRLLQGRSREVAKQLRWYIEIINPPKPRSAQQAVPGAPVTGI